MQQGLAEPGLELIYLGWLVLHREDSTRRPPLSTLCAQSTTEATSIMADRGTMLSSD